MAVKWITAYVARCDTNALGYIYIYIYIYIYRTKTCFTFAPITRCSCAAACPGDDVTDVFIVINSVGHVDGNGTAIWRRLELVWHTAQVQADDQVGLAP